MKSLLSSLAEGFLTPVSMQTTHSELPGPSTGLGAEGVTGVPGVNGGLGTLEAEALGRYAGDKGAGAVRPTSASSSCSRALHAPGGGGDRQRIAYRLSLNSELTSSNSINSILCPPKRQIFILFVLCYLNFNESICKIFLY